MTDKQFEKFRIKLDLMPLGYQTWAKGKHIDEFNHYIELGVTMKPTTFGGQFDVRDSYLRVKYYLERGFKIYEKTIDARFPSIMNLLLVL